MKTGRPLILNNEEECIHWYIKKYYQELERNPGIRSDIDEHIRLIEQINEEYNKALKKNKDFNYELFEGRFIECIDFLTKVFTKKKEKELALAWKKEFREGVINIKGYLK